MGATGLETALLLRVLGAESGLLMDGDGSSALVLEYGGKVTPVNKPIHGIRGRERAVATCIWVSFRQ